MADMFLALPEPATDLATRLATVEMAARAAYCQEQIAESCHVPPEPPAPWAGRDDLVKGCAKQFGITRAEAGLAVDGAVAELWAKQVADPVPVMKRLMLLRFKAYRQLVLNAIRNGRKEETFQYKPLGELDPKVTPTNLLGGDPTMLVEIKVREKRYTGVDMSAVNQLLAIERCIAELEGLNGKSSDGALNVVGKFFAGLDELAQRQREKQLADAEPASLAHRAKSRGIADLDPDGRKRVLASVLEAQPKTPKKVRARKASPAEGAEDEDAT